MKSLKLIFILCLAVITIAVFTSCERKVTNETTKIVSPGDAKYVGSETCQPCHADNYADFMQSGHPYKLNDAVDAQQPGYYPFGDLEGPPPGMSWDQVRMVIGGFRWKARFINQEGYIITGDDASATTQWNLPTNDHPESEWVGYHAGQKNVEYKCGPCHMTAYSPEGNQLGLPGLIGTWEFNGVQCEECHGPGEFHAEKPESFAMKIDRTNQQCGKCHIRGDKSEIPASGGFIKHHEQWNEIFRSKHLALQCVDCHDPHKGLHEKNPNRAAAIRSKCESCHFDEAGAYEESALPHEGLNIDCIACHMPKAAKSARSVAEYVGDVRSHLFGINTDPDAEMFNAEGNLANGYLTLEYTCLQCHSTKDKEWAAAAASAIHPVSHAGASEYVGSSTCATCHETIYSDFVKSGHPYKLNKAADAQQPGYYPFGDLEGPPDGYTWDQVSYVIGGFRWKARFIDLNGYIITGEDAEATTQWNLPTNDDPEPEWVGYHAGEKNVEYNCGPCHMTAYNPVGNQDGLPGMVGTWEFGGIQCEECHGAGEQHTQDPRGVQMVVERSNHACGKCHIRGDVGDIPASGGFVKHHEQWNELFSSKHASIGCVDCHDPHKGLHEKNPDRAAAIKSKCESCHFKEAGNFAKSDLPMYGEGVTCLDCHMPKAAKSARSVATYVGDVRSHMFGINTDPDAPMFSADGKSALGYLTLDFTCLKCHTDEDKSWAAENAHNVHPDENSPIGPNPDGFTSYSQ